MAQRINPSTIHALNEALSLAFWYKKDLRAFLSTALPDNQLVAQLDWTGEYKRNLVRQLTSTMCASEHKYQEELLDLILSTADMGDPLHLKRVEDGDRKYEEAVAAIAVLKDQVQPYRNLRDETEQADRRRREEAARAEQGRAVAEKLKELQQQFFEILAEPPQKRGYSLEKFLNQIFALFDIDAKSSFKVVGEQIDGAFTFEGTEYLFEAKWQKDKVSSADLDVFTGKVRRKLENTLGLFLSMNGYETTGMDLHSQHGSAIFLMDGSDLAAVLEDRITLPDLLTRKRQHASRTGQIMLSAFEVLQSES